MQGLKTFAPYDGRRLPLHVSCTILLCLRSEGVWSDTSRPSLHSVLDSHRYMVGGWGGGGSKTRDYRRYVNSFYVRYLR